MIRPLTTDDRVLLACESGWLVSTAIWEENGKYSNLNEGVIRARCRLAHNLAYRQAFDHAYAKAEETRRDDQASAGPTETRTPVGPAAPTTPGTPLGPPAGVPGTTSPASTAMGSGAGGGDPSRFGEP